jgi:chloramphenicol 3-O phosphotransferase
MNGRATIIYLNGVSSSGKTSLGRALQEVMAEPYFHVQLDHFGAMKPRRPRPEDTSPLWRDLIDHLYPAYLVPAFHGGVAHFAARGANVIADSLVGRPGLVQAAQCLAEHRLVLVGVRCALDELERRERARTEGRPLGQARRQYDWLHKDVVYDLEVDTSNASPAECALQINDWLAAHPSPTAANRLRSSAGI